MGRVLVETTKLYRKLQQRVKKMVSPVNQVAIAADPWNAEDAVIGVFEGCHNHGGGGVLIVENDREFKRS